MYNMLKSNLSMITILYRPLMSYSNVGSWQSSLKLWLGLLILWCLKVLGVKLARVCIILLHCFIRIEQ